jgi:hypothetical protein
MEIVKRALRDSEEKHVVADEKYIEDIIAIVPLLESIYITVKILEGESSGVGDVYPNVVALLERIRGTEAMKGHIR